jgi:hypothetical protein
MVNCDRPAWVHLGHSFSCVLSAGAGGCIAASVARLHGRLLYSCLLSSGLGCLKDNFLGLEKWVPLTFK